MFKEALFQKNCLIRKPIGLRIYFLGELPSESGYSLKGVTLLQHIFSEELLFYGFTSFSQIHFLFYQLVITYVHWWCEILSCRSTFVQIHIIDIVYLMSWLHKVLWKTLFLSALLFQSFCFLRTATKQLISRKSYFFRLYIFRTAGFSCLLSF